MSDSYPRQVVDAATDLFLPAAPRRRSAEESRFAASLPLIRDSVDWLAGSLRDGRADDALSHAYEISLEISSFLYAAGADHNSWRAWSALAAWGSALQGDVPGAVPYAVLSGSWKHFGAFEVTGAHESLSSEVVRNLAFGTGKPMAGPGRVDEADKAWLTLATAIPRSDHARCEESLQTLADFWTEEDEEWDLFEPRGYPCFDPWVCAAAALARESGYRPRGLSRDARRFLDPGLAPQCPDPFATGTSPR
ncbi:hypothetical protein ACH4JS_05625 [Streptomyces sp. NPDC017638]|uniref:hypothetical protein n=1 Tax=Streptomyces sp. NPDC017638 TaxID=3365004 RepID=UPI0037A0CAAF